MCEIFALERLLHVGQWKKNQNRFNFKFKLLPLVLYGRI